MLWASELHVADVMVTATGQLPNFSKPNLTAHGTTVCHAANANATAPVMMAANSAPVEVQLQPESTATVVIATAVDVGSIPPDYHRDPLLTLSSFGPYTRFMIDLADDFIKWIGFAAACVGLVQFGNGINKIST